MKLLVATTNPGKLREIAGILQGASVELVTLDDYPADSRAGGDRTRRSPKTRG